MRKRATRRRRYTRAAFGQITYWYETAAWLAMSAVARKAYLDTADGAAGYRALNRVRKIVYVKRMFPTYGEAVLHLTNVKLGITKEDPKWSGLRVYKIINGYRQRGKKVIVSSKIIEKPELKTEEEHERISVGRDQARSRLLRQHGPTSFSFPQSMGTTVRLPRQGTATYVGGGNWSVTGPCSTATMVGTGAGTFTVSIPNWDRLPVSALV